MPRKMSDYDRMRESVIQQRKDRAEEYTRRANLTEAERWDELVLIAASFKDAGDAIYMGLMNKNKTNGQKLKDFDESLEVVEQLIAYIKPLRAAVKNSEGSTLIF